LNPSSEIAARVECDVDQGVLGEFTTVVPGQCVHASLQGLQGVDDGPHDRIGLAIGYTTHLQQAGLAVNQCHDPRESVAHDGVTFPVAGPLEALHDGRPLGDAPPMKALALSWRSTTMATALLAAA
jgi:hypothetical protein